MSTLVHVNNSSGYGGGRPAPLQVQPSSPKGAPLGIVAPKRLHDAASRRLLGEAGGVDLDIVPAPRVYPVFQMRAALTDPSIATNPLSSLQLADFTVHADEEHRVMTEQSDEIDVPTAELDHVLDNHVVAGIRDHRGTPVKSVEEARPDGPPRPFPDLRLPIDRRQDICRHKLVGRKIESDPNTDCTARPRVVLPALLGPFRSMTTTWATACGTRTSTWTRPSTR